MASVTAALDVALRAAVPAIVGVRVGKAGDKATWSAVFPEGYVPSAEERDAVASAISGFDAVAAARPRFIDPSAIVSRLQPFAAELKAFVDSDAQAWMFWQRMVGRNKPIDTADPEFPQAWALLQQVIGKTDADRIRAEILTEAT